MKILQKLLPYLLVLVVAGQGLIANAFSCQMPMNAESMSAVMDVTAIDHSVHHISASALTISDNDETKNCCDAMLCTIGHCQSAPALLRQSDASSPYYAPVYVNSNAAASPTPLLDSLYRPPIFR